jgi:hypothetical protein
MMNNHRKSMFALILLAPLCLGGCQVVGFATNLLSALIPAAVSIGGAVATYYLIKEIEK